MEKEVLPKFEARDIIRYLGYFGLLLFALTYMPFTAIANMSYIGDLGGAGTWVFYGSMLFLVLMPIFHMIKAKSLAHGSFGVSMFLVAISMFMTGTGEWASKAVTYWYTASGLTLCVGVLFIALAFMKEREKYEEMGAPSILWLIIGILVSITVYSAGKFAREFSPIGGSYSIGDTITYADLYPQLIYFGGKLTILWAVGTVVSSIIVLIKKYRPITVLTKKYGMEHFNWPNHSHIDKVEYAISSLTQVSFLIGALLAGSGGYLFGGQNLFTGWPIFHSQISGALFLFFATFKVLYQFLWALLGICFILTILHRIIKKKELVTE